MVLPAVGESNQNHNEQSPSPLQPEEGGMRTLTKGRAPVKKSGSRV